ncbi:hypothetical protein Daesc_008673 [Daldinia eschscholtzii]|uniref:Uncharacterized protein n=1 Tax=Daldinia eschscholtzii TaxID=292717 RepID=A0AAX6MD89_9PEZI
MSFQSQHRTGGYKADSGQVQAVCVPAYIACHLMMYKLPHPAQMPGLKSGRTLTTSAHIQSEIHLGPIARANIKFKLLTAARFVRRMGPDNKMVAPNTNRSEDL